MDGFIYLDRVIERNKNKPSKLLKKNEVHTSLLYKSIQKEAMEKVYKLMTSKKETK